MSTSKTPESKDFLGDAQMIAVGENWLATGSNLNGKQTEQDPKALQSALASVNSLSSKEKESNNQPSADKPEKIITVDQWIEVARRFGNTITKCFPSNEKLLKQLDEMPIQPHLIYRRINFRQGVPVEYDWVHPNPIRRLAGGVCIQRLTPEDFRATAAKETRGHVISGSDPRPKPQARGGCTCPACTRQTEKLKAEGVPFV